MNIHIYLIIAAVIGWVATVILYDRSIPPVNIIVTI